MRIRYEAVIGRALEAARAVLRDLDPDQVPASLRRVVGHAGDLTPPLADRLAREIDRLEWLRHQAAESWPEADHSSPGADRASALFLLRPDGWPVDFLKEVAESAAGAAAATGRRETRAVDDLDRKLEVARDKTKAAAREIVELRRKIAELERALRAPDRERAAAEARDQEAARLEAERHSARVTDLERRLAETEATLRAAREEIRSVKVGRAEAERRLAAVRHAGSWADRDPLDLAVHLDAVAAQARPRPVHEGGMEVLPVPTLPKGVRPDRADAIDALLRLPGPLAVLVDGYNAGMALGRASPGEVRGRLEDVLRRLRRLGGRGFTVTVVWDSASEMEGRRIPEGLDVRFAPTGVPADDILVDLASAASRPVVVTNDREVRERAEAVGALTLWSTALVEWARKR
jgi:hypothetical protein